MLGGLERAEIERLGLDGRELSFCAITRERREAPCFVVSLSEEIVHRQQLGDILLVPDRLNTDHVADLGMKLTPPPERQPFVRGISHQRMAESVTPCRLGLNELTESAPGAWVSDLLSVLEECGDQVVGEARPQNRGIAEQPPIRERQAIDLRGNDRIDRRWETFDATGGARSVEKLSEVQGVPA